METYTVKSKKSGQDEYTIKAYADVLGQKTYELSYAKSQTAWINPGEIRLIITDTGDDLKITPKLKKKFDYDRFDELHILMAFIKSHDKNLMEDYEIIEEVLKTEI
jgi:hypothetical protein